jgi:hypothetical protein
VLARYTRVSSSDGPALMLWCAIVTGTLLGFGLALVLFGDLAPATPSRESHLSWQAGVGHASHAPRQ